MSSQEEPEDQPPADETAEDEPSAGAEAGDTEQPEERRPEAPDDDDSDDDAGDDAPPTDEERIDRITERIDKARTKAEEAGILEDTADGEYVESGATEEDDDQNITPPG